MLNLRPARRSQQPDALRPRLAVLAVVAAAGLTLFVAVEPTRPWFLLLIVVFIALGADGILRMHPSAPALDAAWTAPLVVLPSLTSVTAGLLLEAETGGYWALPAAILAAVIVAATVNWEYLSVDTHGPNYHVSRSALNLAAILTALAFYIALYSLDTPVLPAAVSAGLVSMLLCLELLREVDTGRAQGLALSAVVGVIVMVTRLALEPLSVERHAAAVALLLVFYVTSSLFQHYLTDDVRPAVAGEFVVVAVAGLAFVALAGLF